MLDWAMVGLTVGVEVFVCRRNSVVFVGVELFNNLCAVVCCNQLMSLCSQEEPHILIFTIPIYEPMPPQVSIAFLPEV